jgi:hypothetical protein
MVGGTADPTWQPDGLGSSVLLSQYELAGHDHALQAPGDPNASLAALKKVTKQVERFLGGSWLG